MDRMDQKDQQIVKLLCRNARLSYSEIGNQVGLSRTAVRNRISALESAGILTGYHAVVNLQNISQAVTFLVTIETEPAQFARIRDALVAEDHAVTVVQTTGDCHLLAICTAPSRQDLRDFLNRLYQSVPGIKSVHAHTVLDVPKGSLLPDNAWIEVHANDKTGTSAEIMGDRQ